MRCRTDDTFEQEHALSSRSIDVRLGTENVFLAGKREGDGRFRHIRLFNRQLIVNLYKETS